MGLEGFPVRVPLLVSSVLFSPLLKNSQNTKVDNYMYLGHSFFNYHALFQMSPMDELPVPSDWPTTSKFSRLPCSLENAEYTHTQTHTHIHIYIYIYIIFFFKFDSLWFCTSLLQSQEIYVTRGVAGGIGPASGRQNGLQNEYFKWKHDFLCSTICIVLSRL